MQKEHNILSTKIPIYAVERAVAAQAFGFEKTDKLLAQKMVLPLTATGFINKKENWKMEFRKIFDTIPEQFDKFRPTLQSGAFWQSDCLCKNRAW